MRSVHWNLQQAVISKALEFVHAIVGTGNAGPLHTSLFQEVIAIERCIAEGVGAEIESKY